MDNLNISCVDAKEVTKMIQWLDSGYGEIHRSRGKRHYYLGMWIDYSILGEVRIFMEEYEGSAQRLPGGNNRDTRNTCRREPFQCQVEQQARDTRQDMGSGIPSRSGTVTIHRDTMQEGRTDVDGFPNNESEEAVRGRLEET